MDRAKQTRVDMAWLHTAMTFGLGMSKDPECKLGACVVHAHGRMVSFGYNGLPSGVPDTGDVWGDKAVKNAIVKHAEENAISQAPFDTHGSTVYVPRKPCHQCLGTIVNAGCARLVFMHDPRPWRYENNEAFELIRQSSSLAVHVYQYSGEAVALLDAFGALPENVNMREFTPPAELDLSQRFPFVHYELQLRHAAERTDESGDED